jgi:hypothetical protein
MLTLNRMHELLQACTTQEEAYKVIALVAGELFTEQSGCLAILHASDRYLERVAPWGNEVLVEPVFSLEDCWALRRDQLHEVTDSRAGLVCRHFVDKPRAGYLCVPLTVQGERVEQICAMVKEMQSRHGDSRPGTISVSAGIAQAGVHASDPNELLRAADKALYAAKAAGGGRVAVYQAKET